MIFNTRSNRFGTSALFATVLVASSATVSAETAMTINGVDIDSAVIDTYTESRFQKPAMQVTPDERAVVEQELTDIYLLTTQPSAKKFAEDPSIKAQIELQYRGTLAQAVARDYIESNPATEEEIFAEYETQLTMAPSQQYKARHILVESQAAAQELITQLEDGADFQELAREHSTGPSGPQGGDLGWFAPDQMVAPFSDAVSELEDGAIYNRTGTDTVWLARHSSRRVAGERTANTGERSRPDQAKGRADKIPELHRKSCARLTTQKANFT